MCLSFHQSRDPDPEQREGPVDAAGLPASKAVRCEGVVEQSDPETRYTRRQGGPAVSGHTYIHTYIILHCCNVAAQT